MEIRYPDAELVRRAREQLGLTRARAARASGIAPETLRRLEAGGRVLASTLRKFARAVGLTSRDLLHPEQRQPELPFEYDVAISFASPDRLAAHAVEHGLAEFGFDVFYDRARQAHLWGTRLPDSLGRVFEYDARYCIAIVSENYAASVWARHELAHAVKRMNRSDSPYLLPVRLDDVFLQELPETLSYLDLRNSSFDQLVRTFAQRVALDTPVAA